MDNSSELNSTSKNGDDKVHKVLHIDDDEDFLFITKAHLDKICEGIAQIETISSPELVFDHLQKNEYDVIVCDYQMPEFDGLDVLKKIRLEGISIPFIIFTGKGREEVAIEALNLGADYYITKGADIKSMYTELCNLIIKAATHGKSVKALERSELKYKAIFENTGTATVIIENDTIISLANSHFELLSGYSKEEIEGKKSWTEFIVPEDLGKMRKYHEDRRTNGLSAPTSYSFQFFDKDGNIKDILLSVDLIPGSLKSVASLVDITEMKQLISGNINLNQLLIVLRNVNQLITQEKNSEELIEKACEILQDNQGFSNPWIILLDDSGKTINFAEKGESNIVSNIAEQLQRGKLSGACKKAFESNKLTITERTEEICADCMIYNICEDERRIILPLLYNGNKYGLISVSISSDLNLDMSNVSLFSELASDIAFALFKINLEEQHEKDQETIIANQKELELERNRLKQYLEIVGVMIAAIDEEARVQLINKKGSEILGYTEEEILGKNWFDTFLPEAVRENTKAIFDKYMHNEIGNREYFENEIITKSGEKRLISWSNTIIQDENGKIKGTLSSGEDITEKRKAETELRERVKDLSCLYTVSDLFTDIKKPIEEVVKELMVTIQKAVLYPEIAMVRIYITDEVYTTSDFNETPWKISAKIESNGENSGLIEVFYEDKKPELFEGSFLEEEANLIKTIAIESGKFLKRRKLNEILAEKEEWYNTTLQSIGDAVIATNIQGQITFMNHVAEDLTGWKLEDANSQPLTQVFRIENELTGKPVKNPFEKIVANGEVVGLANHTQILSKDGRRIPIADSGAPIKNRKGEIIGVVIVFRDVTSIRAEQLEQEHYSEEIQFFVNLLTHDVKNILAITSGYLSIIMEGDTEIDYVNFISKIYQSNIKAVTLLNNVSLLMKLYSPEQKEVSLQPFEVKETIQKAVEAVKIMFPSKIIEINYSGTEEKLFVLADLLSEQLFMNIISNSAKNDHRENVSIEINNTKISSNRCRIAISDYGKGIKPEERKNLFEKYSSTDKFRKVSGLGLFIVKTLVERYGGKISVESRVADDYSQGTTFIIEFETT
ncbi:MAG: PAS domain S-box protein [Candidatus Heimdallarchaeaceae archaeon]